MADGNVIDELQLYITGNASKAVRGIDKLTTSLTKMADALGKVSEKSSGISGLTGLANSIQALGNMDHKNINKAVSALRRLSKIDFSNLSGKNLSININTGNVQQAVKSINTFKKSAAGVTTMRSRFAEIGRLGSSFGQMLESGFNRGSRAVKSGVRSMMNHLKQLRSSLSLVKTAAYSVRAAFTSLLGFHGLTSVFRGLKNSIVAGGDITEIDHIVESVFAKNMVGYVHEWADAAIESFGIASAQAKQYAGTLSAMFQSSGIGASSAGKMAMDLVGLAGDLSAFYNEDTAISYEKIKSGLAGMVRPLRAYGIDLTAATLEEFRLAQGIETAYSAMTQAEKVMLRYQYLMTNTATQQGDFERTQYSLANATRTLKANISALSTQIGVGLAAAIRPAIVALNVLMKHLIRAAKAFATFMQTIFGKYKGGASGVALEGVEDSADFAEELADGAGGAAGALEDADEAAKKLKKDLSVLPFDELNQLNKDREDLSSDKDSGSGAGGGAGGLGDLGDIGFDFEDAFGGSALAEAISEWGDRIKNAFKAKDWESLGYQIAWGINKGIDKVYDVLDPKKVKKKVDPFINAFTQSFNSLVDNIKWEKMGRTLGRGVNDIVYILDSLITKINWKNLGRRLADGANGLVDEVDFTAVGDLIGHKFMIVWNVLYGFAKNFDWKNLGKKLGNGINGLNEAINWGTVATALTDSFNGAFDALREFTQRVKWGDIADNIVNGLNTAIRNFNWARNGESLGMFISDLCDTLIDIIDRTDWEGFGEGLALALQKIPWGKLLKVVGKVIVDVFGGILKGMASTPAGTFAAALIAALAAFKFSKTAFGAFAGKIVNGICAGLTGKSAMQQVGGAASKLVHGGLSGLTATTGGTAVAFAGLTVALVAAVRELAKVEDAARGGNGALSDMGTAVDNMIAELGASNMLTEEQAKQLFALKENAEDTGKSAEEFGYQFMEALSGMSIGLPKANEMLSEMEKTAAGSKEEFQKFADGVRSFDEVITVAGGNVNMAGTEMSTAVKDIKQALLDMFLAGEIDNFDLLSANFDSTVLSANSAQEAYKMAADQLSLTGNDVDSFNEKLVAMGYEYANHAETVRLSDGAVVESMQSRSDLTTEAMRKEQQEYQNTYERKREAEKKMVEETIAKAEEQATALEEWQKNISEFRDLAVQKLTEIGDSWGDLDLGQSETLEELTKNLEESITAQDTAIENMRQLNEKGLDNATVQAIVKQIDPSSQAMTDLIAHMQADDATWQEFHSKLQENLSMEEDIQKMADDMALKFAEKTKPAFVQMGEDAKVESGKVGGFIVDGVVQGVYDSTDKAVGEIKTLAYKMQDKFKEIDQIHSPSRVYEGFAKDDIQGFVNGIKANQNTAITQVKDMATKIQDALKTLPDNFKEYGSRMVEALKKELEKLTTTFTDAFAKAAEVIDKEKTEMTTRGKELGDNFVGGLSTGLDEASQAASDMITELRSNLTISLYEEGQAAGQSFADGFSSVNVPTPHMYVSAWDYVDLGDGGGMYTPSFDVSWYRAGGLFKGGNGQIIGIAESNRDEAVLPLEDRRAMARIGSAIADAGGAFGDESMMDRLAGKIAETIIMTQTEQSDPIFHIEVKTEDNETLARAVTRGQRQMDYRNNPTPAFGY